MWLKVPIRVRVKVWYSDRVKTRDSVRVREQVIAWLSHRVRVRVG